MSSINCILSKIQKTTLSGQQLFHRGRGHDQRKNISAPPCSLCFRKFTFYIIIIGLLLVKNPLPIQETEETHIQSPGREDPLEEGMANDSSILAWRIPWTEQPGGLQSTGLQRVGHDWSDWAQACILLLKIIIKGHLWCFSFVQINWRLSSLEKLYNVPSRGFRIKLFKYQLSYFLARWHWTNYNRSGPQISPL